MMKNNMVLVGFMGTGKSTVGKELAHRLGKVHVDLDQAIVEHEKSDIPTIFLEKGEAYFRDVESRLLEELLQKENIVLTTGGGAVLRPNNVTIMMLHSIVITLTAAQEEIIKRVSQDTNRPLLAGDVRERVASLMEARKGLYDFAPVQVDTTDRSVENIVEEIIKKTIEERDFRRD
ncbi:shikimate kinase [Brevibacillus sp. SYSU BS000544]|uniref:shikimate kinase n=1 Tax=Brevibacillus sp. SYSU BS000544 TaxID=3416443 RepID=UPI003CE58543